MSQLDRVRLSRKQDKMYIIHLKNLVACNLKLYTIMTSKFPLLHNSTASHTMA